MAQAQTPFTDLGGVPWAVQAIDDLYARGTLQGVAPGVFGPDLNLTRAQAVTALGRLQGWNVAAAALPPGASFQDWSQVPGWAEPYAAAAVARGVVQGLPGGYFAPSADVSWDELAVMAARAFAYPPVPADQVTPLLGQLNRGGQVPTWAQQGVAAAVQAGDLSGVLAGSFDPGQPATRAELALFLDRAVPGGASQVASLTLGPSPIAAPASLAAGQTVGVTVTAANSGHDPVAGATVYLAFAPAPGGGAATVNGTPVGSTPAPFTTDGSGRLAVSYAAPGTLPTAGTDRLTAASLPGGAGVTATTGYRFSSAPEQVAALHVSPNPVAATGTLAAGQSVDVVVTALDSVGEPLPGANVYLAFSAGGGGSAAVNGAALLSTPSAVTAGGDGTVVVRYTAPSPLPGSGTDVLTATNAAAYPTVVASTTYSYAGITPGSQLSALSISPDPIAAAGSLTAGQSVVLTVTATNSSQQPAAGVAVYLSLARGAVGTAQVNGTALTATPQAFSTDGAGRITVIYTAGPPSGSGGTDTLTASSAPAGGQVTGSDSYSMAGG